MPEWAVWMIVAGVLAIGEIATGGQLVLGLIALAAVAAAVIAALGPGLAWQLGVFVLATLGLLAGLRPLIRRHVSLPSTRTGAAALVGARAVVVARVDADGGRVKLAGEEWSARAYFEDQVMEPGARVEVVKIEGATALVHE